MVFHGAEIIEIHKEATSLLLLIVTFITNTQSQTPTCQHSLSFCPQLHLNLNLKLILAA